jgi:hypothetical protein
MVQLRPVVFRPHPLIRYLLATVAYGVAAPSLAPAAVVAVISFFGEGRVVTRKYLGAVLRCGIRRAAGTVLLADIHKPAHLVTYGRAGGSVPWATTKPAVV